MNKLLQYTWICLIASLCLLSCNGSEDLRGEFDDLKMRVDALESQVGKLNKNLETIQKLLQKGATITQVETLADESYKITLSNGDVLNLAQFTDKPTCLPLIGIQNGNWAVSYDNGNTFELILMNGAPVKAEGEAGANGKTPSFRVEAATGYWQISYDGGTNYQYVLNEKGDKVEAVGKPQEGTSDKFFKDVTLTGDQLQITLKDADETVITVPIVKDFYLRIKNAQGIQQFEVSATRTYEVELNKVSSTLIDAPSGWKVSLSEPQPNALGNGFIAQLSVTAPITATTTRAAADNNKDISIIAFAATNGYACAAKMQVEATDKADYLATYNAGGDIIIGKTTVINKTTYPDFVIMDATATGTDVNLYTTIQNASTASLIIFLKGQGSNFIIKKEGTGGSALAQVKKEIIVIGQDPNAQPTIQPQGQIALVSGALLFKNIRMDMSQLSNYLYNQTGAITDFKAFVYDGCHIDKLTNTLTYFKIPTCGVNSIRIVNSKISFNLAENNTASINIIGLSNSSAPAKLSSYNEFVFSNNVVSNNAIMKCAIWNEPYDGNDTYDRNMSIENNTFVNITPISNNPYFRINKATSLIIKHNIFYLKKVAAATNCILYSFSCANYADHSDLWPVLDVNENIVYDENVNVSSQPQVNWSKYYGGITGSTVKPAGANTIPAYASLPLVIDYANNSFTPIDELKSTGYGSTIQ